MYTDEILRWHYFSKESPEVDSPFLFKNITNSSQVTSVESYRKNDGVYCNIKCSDYDKLIRIKIYEDYKEFINKCNAEAYVYICHLIDIPVDPEVYASKGGLLEELEVIDSSVTVCTNIGRVRIHATKKQLHYSRLVNFKSESGNYVKVASIKNEDGIIIGHKKYKCYDENRDFTEFRKRISEVKQDNNLLLGDIIDFPMEYFVEDEELNEDIDSKLKSLILKSALINQIKVNILQKLI